MATKFPRLLVFVMILAFILCFPKITIAAPAIFNANPTATISQQIRTRILSDIDLTPQFRQKLQGVRQRRNRDIQKVLSASEQTQLIHNLRAGDRLPQALDKLKLSPDRREMIKAIVKISELKTKAILSGYPLK
ncbi:hypothetical protein [Calothrix rhizosoleniae]|uniref:hypothetical protein n=2 Tax=Calothrix rhizosoleniae TaxID=888997 RepID=UPI000B497386